MAIAEWISALLTGLGTLFFIASTLGVLRFPDIYCRLHALTKADNVGLGLIVIGVAIRNLDVETALKLLLIGLLVTLSSSASCYLIARTAKRNGIRPWDGR